MTAGAGVVRTEASLASASIGLADLAAERQADVPSTEAWETSNLHDVAATLVRHATLRTETRGGHWREDYPDRDDSRWRGRLVTTVSDDGTVQTRFEELR
jgi:L-aspartate oxidase